MNKTNSKKRLFLQHPKKTIIVVNAVVIAFVVITAELFLRFYLDYNPGYYMAFNTNDREIDYPYGTIKINSHGLPDDEFNLTSSQTRVGYFGDSVIYGVGAGYGYRISEHLANQYPELQHMNFAQVGTAVTNKETILRLKHALDYKLDTLIYFFNQNDILPTQDTNNETNTTPLVKVRYWLSLTLDWFRGRSYLYTFIRSATKNYLMSKGYGFHGHIAYERYPEQYENIIADTAARINNFKNILDEHDINFILVILPLEMQISAEAEQVYAEHKITWDTSYILGRTQQTLIQHLDPRVNYFDAYYAFVDPYNIESSRKNNKAGEYFVYNKGDKLDWNHPNRKGHEAIANFLIENDVFRLTTKNQLTTRFN